MGDFSKSTWANEAFADNYIERADIYIAERGRLLGLLASVYRHISGGRRGLSVSDLGSGDGIITQTLLREDSTISATLIDASSSMLKKARDRLSAYKGLNYMEAGFEDIIDGRAALPPSDLFVSSMAIHHLDMKGKAALFGLILKQLKSGGHFINIDTVLPPTKELENLYFSLWSQWMQHMMDRAGVTDQTPPDVIALYTDPLGPNRPDTLESQMDALRSAGFINVDCFYKNGIFAIFGGQKP